MINLYITNQLANANISTYQVNPEWNYALKDPGECSWSIALSQKNINGNPVQEDEFGSKRTDYILKASDDGGSTFTNLQGGRLLDVDLESDTGNIKCAGKDWLEYTDQPYPFDYSVDPDTIASDVDNIFLSFVGASGTDTANVKYNSTQQKVITKLLAAMSALSTITYTPNFQGTGWTEVSEYGINYLDPTTVLQHIKNLSNLKDPFGFDFWCDWDGTVFLYAPRLITSPSSVVSIADFVYGDDAVVKVKWHNGGPKATRTVATTSGGIWKQDPHIYQPSIDTYRESLQFVTLGDAFNHFTDLANLKAALSATADAQGTKDRNPQHDVTITFDPRLMFPTSELAGFVPMIGNAITYDSGDEFMPYHRVNAKYWVVSQRYTPQDDEGNYLMEAGLQQIYTT